MRKGLLLIVTFAVTVFGQLYQGPAQGTVASGVSINVGTFERSIVNPPKEERFFNKHSYVPDPMYIDFGKETTDPLKLYTEDRAANRENLDTAAALLVKSFNGLNQTNSIPPDPYCAVGPTHIMATVNSSFGIWDKKGNHVITVDADNFYSNLATGLGVFDPKVLYDHFDKRWIMVWLNQDDASQVGDFIVSISDDSIPTGTWYNWRLSSVLNGTTSSGSWGDYQGVGFDKNAIYITANQFAFGGSFQYVKLRIIPKAQLLSGPGSLTYTDLWDIRYPHNSSRIFNLRPAIMYNDAPEYYLIHAPSNGANFHAVYKLINPTANPSMTGAVVAVSFYSNAPNPSQLGGGTLRLEGGGSAIRNEPKYRDGFLYSIHATANPTNGSYSALHYTKISVSSNTTTEENFFGSPGFWYFYPALEIDKNHNIAAKYSRSGDTAYAGAFYSTRLANGPAGFTMSNPLRYGLANYVKDFGSGRNRWGDYNGINVDPSNWTDVFMFGEYVISANTWATWWGQIFMSPYSGLRIFKVTDKVDFETVEVGFKSDTLTAEIANFGTADYVISGISNSKSQFKIVSSHTFPLTMRSYDTLRVKYVFEPTQHALYEDSLKLTSVSGNEYVALKGKGYTLAQSAERQMYASAKTGNILTLNKLTGTGTLLGASGYTDMSALAINHKKNLLFGVVNQASNSILVRLNAAAGDAYKYSVLPFTNVSSMAFDTSGALYVVQRTGELYSVNLATGQPVYVDSIKTNVNGIAFHPVTNELWATMYKPIGTGKDKIFKVNITTGDTTNVGVTGYNVMTNDIEFDESGQLFGVKGTATAANDLFKINTTTGAGTIVGTIGIPNVVALAYDPGTITGVKDDPKNASAMPESFFLGQNYPNPFNPSTIISYGLPKDADVSLVVYNLLGEVVTELVNQSQKAGYYQVSFSASNIANTMITSGIYFYELKARSGETNFSEVRKMVYLR